MICTQVDRGAARDLKEGHCVVPKGYGLAVQVARDKQSFELPDGTVVDVSPELARSTCVQINR